jgi:RNA polymerase sigma factor (sigma-70 family)
MNLIRRWSGLATRDEVEAVYRSHGGTVWRAVLAMSAGSREVADEATCEAFARLYAYRDGVRDPVAWVFRTAFRLAGRELTRQRLQVDDAAASEGSSGEVSVLPSAVAAGLRRLSPEQRSAVFLHYFADMPVGEVARLAGVPTATIKVRLHRARRTLRDAPEMLEAGGV